MISMDIFGYLGIIPSSSTLLVGLTALFERVHSGHVQITEERLGPTGVMMPLGSVEGQASVRLWWLGASYMGD